MPEGGEGRRGAPAGAVPPRPAPLDMIPPALCRGLSFLFTDIDDTLTTDGLLLDSSFGALWRLARAGIRVVAVTGRPAGWCDHIARMWPVAGVVGENGAFCFLYDRGRRFMKRSYHPALGGAADRTALAKIAERVFREVPGTAYSADQAFRISDVAIDYCEDVPPLPPEKVQEVCRILSEEGATFKVSSIHVNFWKGDFDKLAGVALYLAAEGRTGRETEGDEALFIGDSPNDEPLFAGFAHSIAVGNLRRFLPLLKTFPEYIAKADAGEGFCEAADLILSNRAPAGRTP
jgi:HAD superfamily hydrolase (TIGR01484 family)